MPRKQNIEELSVLLEQDKRLYNAQQHRITMGTWDDLFVKTVYTIDLCQIFECIHNVNVHDEDIPHKHENSQELFYQLAGITTFDDGTVLLPGQTKVIPPNVPHKVTLSKDGKCIAILHPPLQDIKFLIGG